MKLDVFHDNVLVGVAVSGPDDRFSFTYDEGWRQLRGFPLSMSLPTSRAEYPAKLAHPFFANLLPEGPARVAVAERLGVSVDNDVSLLAAVGNDTAGAFRFVSDSDEPPEDRGRRPINPDMLDQWAGGAAPVDLPDGPIRLSIAGAQHKTTAVRQGDAWALPASTEASTHILKFDSPRFPWLCVNEFYVTRVAKALGLETCEVALEETSGRPFLAVTRYDRSETANGVERLHQEDFCQAFALPPTRKYESEGGPSLARIAGVLRSNSLSGVSDTARLVRWTVFCALVGNADGHAKNLSVLYAGNGFRLAPHYDLVCTRAFERLDPLLAFAVGGQRDTDKLDAARWTSFAEDVGVSAKLVARELERQLANLTKALNAAQESTLAAIGEAPTLPVVRRAIEKRARALER